MLTTFRPILFIHHSGLDFNIFYIEQDTYLILRGNTATGANRGGVYILCSHVTAMATWRATDADKMATNSGQPGELQPCRFPILQSVNYLDHKCSNYVSRKNKHTRNLGSTHSTGWCVPCFEVCNVSTRRGVGDIYIYLIENPSPYDAQKMKAYKSTDS